MILIPLVGIGTALLFEILLARKRALLAGLTALVVVAESAGKMGTVDKLRVRDHVAEVAELIDPSADAFFLVSTEPESAWVAQDAAWASLASGKPTINGRYGNRPLHYRISNPVVGGVDRRGRPISRESLESSLRGWLGEHGLRPERIQWIEYRALTREQVRTEWPSTRSGLGAAPGTRDLEGPR